MEVDSKIESYEEFIRLKPIKPIMSLMEERSDLLDKLIRLQSRNYNSKPLRNYAILVEKLQARIRKIEEIILKGK